MAVGNVPRLGFMPKREALELESAKDAGEGNKKERRKLAEKGLDWEESTQLR
jgi:hypothetical protein